MANEIKTQEEKELDSKAKVLDLQEMEDVGGGTWSTLSGSCKQRTQNEWSTLSTSC